MKKAALSLAAVAILCLFGWQLYESQHGHTVLDYRAHISKEPIKIGVLHSLVGTMAASEKPAIDAVTLAVEEINADGGLLGRELQLVLADGRSDLQTFESEAERLINVESVSAVFGCWTSACRKTVKPVFERHDHLLFYPLQYEGLEQSPNIVYTGAAPNQQIIPAVRWSIDNLGPQLFLVGSDRLFSRASHEIVRDLTRSAGAVVVGEVFISARTDDYDATIDEIKMSKPAVIVSTLDNDAYIGLVLAMQNAGISSEDIPVVAFASGEQVRRQLRKNTLHGHYLSSTYLGERESEFNLRFIESFRKKFGARRIVTDAVESAYTAVHLWAAAVQAANTDATAEVRRHLPGLTFAAPQGPVAVDKYNNHLWKSSYIAQIQNRGELSIVWESGAPISPVPYPPSRNVEYWEWMLNSLYKKWGDRWSGAAL